MPLVKASEAIQTKWEILVYGPPGVGKTSLFADCPKVLYIVVDDNGWIVLTDKPQAANIELFYTRKWSELVQFVLALPTSEVIKRVDTIVVDTISECQTLERLKQIGGNPLTDEKWKFNEHIFTQNNFKIMALIRAIKTTGKNIAWLCHTTIEVLGEGKDAEKLIRPALSPRLLDTVQAGIDGQFHMDKPGGNRILKLDAGGGIQTKSRFKKSRDLVNPTWGQLQEILESRMQR